VIVVKALVVYESMFGDNREVAKAIAGGLVAAGVQSVAVEVSQAPDEVAADVSLVVAGCPNHAWSMPRPSTRETAAMATDQPLVSAGRGIREWLSQVRLVEGVAVAAFDTRSSGAAPVVAMDHASTSIEKRLIKRGGRRLAKPTGYSVVDMKGPLVDGELDRARAWGVRLGEKLHTA
jgi:hypothetical protein